MEETDASITHHVIDRPLAGAVDLSRYTPVPRLPPFHSFLGHSSTFSVYVQPQWVVDCLNARRLLPVNRYAPGAALPPHLSPFINEKSGDLPEQVEQLINDGYGQKEATSSAKSREGGKKAKDAGKKKDNVKMMAVAGRTFKENEQKKRNEEVSREGVDVHMCVCV